MDEDTRTEHEKKLDFALSVMFHGGELPDYISDDEWRLWGYEPERWGQEPLSQLWSDVFQFMRDLLLRVPESK